MDINVFIIFWFLIGLSLGYYIGYHDGHIDALKDLE